MYSKCFFCGNCFVQGSGCRPSTYCSASCRNSSKHLRLFQSSIESIDFTAEALKALKGQLFDIVNKDLRKKH